PLKPQPGLSPASACASTLPADGTPRLKGAAMHTKLAVTVAALGAAAAIGTGIATAGHTATAPERVAITSPHGNSGLFILTPLTPGPIARDAGTATACCWTQRFIRRDGQSIEIN